MPSISAPSTYKFTLSVPQSVRLPGEIPFELEREAFYAWIWERFATEGLIGVHEGTVLSEQAAEQGFETDSWTVDSGEAPKERDWVGRQDQVEAELYFIGRDEAHRSAEFFQRMKELTVGPVEEQKDQDWDAEWKASFLNAGAGVSIAPFWKIIPPWVELEEEAVKFLKINPGAGFGTGTHETTQLCLEAIGEVSQIQALERADVLDFGSGSGILAVGMALLGARVDAVEIDTLAIDNALENARINGVEGRITYAQALSPEPRTYRLIVANILKPVLLEFADQLITRLAPGGALVLSGLIEKDVEPVQNAYAARLGRKASQVYAKNEWRALAFRA
jgi:ribosomal protein L11 methyltransferase